jgi:3-demethoxyubiquinol 3-hydroxylase
MRQQTRTQLLLAEMDRALRTLAAAHTLQSRATPKAAADSSLDATERKHAAGLMRINHAGEIAAQALYFGHAAFSKTVATQAHMLEAAAEEGDHLAWCEQRLTELSAKPTLAGPVFYAGAYALGAASALAGDAIALGFVAETERQVEAHLQDHDDKLPPNDHASRAIIRSMRDDEIAHGKKALQAGGATLSWPVPGLMTAAANVMRWVAYRF